MRQTRSRPFLAACAAAMIAQAAAAEDTERSYLPPQASQPSGVTKSERAASPQVQRRQNKVRARTRRRHATRESEPGPWDVIVFPGVLFFPFF